MAEKVTPVFVESLGFDDLVVQAEYDVWWDDDSATEGEFRATLLEKGNGVTRWSNGVLIADDGQGRICFSLPEGMYTPDQHLLGRIRSA